MEITSMTTEELVSKCVSADRLIKSNKAMLDSFKAELQARGIQVMDDKNIKYVKFFSDDGNCAITDSMSLDILNIDKLKKCIGDGVFNQKVKETIETKYKFDSKLEKMLKAIFTGDYTFEMDMEEFLEHMSVKPDAKQKKMLLKKLKGDYAKDKALLESTFGTETDFDVECWYIYKIKNAELIKAFLPEEGIDFTINELKKCIIVESKTSITLDYKEE